MGVGSGAVGAGVAGGWAIGALGLGGGVLVVLYAAYTLLRVPYEAWCAEYPQGYEQRTDLYSHRALVALAAMLLMALTGAMLEGFSEQNSGGQEGAGQDGAVVRLQVLLLLLAGLSIPALLLFLWRAPVAGEVMPGVGQGRAEGAERVSLASVKAVLGHKVFRRLLLVAFLYDSGRRFRDATLVFFMTYALLMPNRISLAYLSVLVGTVVGLLLWKRLARRWQKHQCLMVGLVATSGLGVLACWLPGAGLVGVLVWMFVAGVVGINPPIMLQSMLADVVSQQRGERKPLAGAATSIFQLSDKLSEALGVGLVFMGLAAVGFDPVTVGWGGVKAADQLDALVWVFAFGPVPFCVLALVLMVRYPLTRQCVAVVDAR